MAMKGRGNGYENDLYWKGVAEICAAQVPVSLVKQCEDLVFR